MELMQASAQWVSRPDDERFVSLDDMLASMLDYRKRSRQAVASSRQLEVIAQPRNDGKIPTQLSVIGKAGVGYEPSNWAFGQLASLVGAPAGYLRTLPAPLAADALTYGLKFERQAKDTGILIRANSEGPGEFLAATGPNYGRVWNSDIVQSLRQRFGSGRDGDWRVPGEFGVAVEVTKANTTLYASDRDMFVFLADEVNRIEVPNRRAGRSGSLARGFFVWNSEVGSRTLGIATFLFDYACCNRIVWGAESYREIKVRHTASAPDKFIEQVQPILTSMRNGSAQPYIDGIRAAQEARIEDINEWLLKRQFSEKLTVQAQARHLAEEGRPMESVWDVVTGLTAVARDYTHQDSRVELETRAGKLIDGVLSHNPKTIELTDLGF